MNKHPGISTVILTEVGAAWKERPWWPSLAGGAFFVLVWWLRGGLTEALPNHPWPWPAGTVRTGWTSEPYILVSLGPDWLLTFSLFSTFQFLVLAALAGGTVALTLKARACAAPGQPAGMAGSLSPALLAALGGTGCCLPLTPLLLSLGGAVATLQYFDGLALGLFACSWLVLTRRLRPSLTEPHALPAWVLTVGMRTLQVAAAVAAARALLRLWPVYLAVPSRVIEFLWPLTTGLAIVALGAALWTYWGRTPWGHRGSESSGYVRRLLAHAAVIPLLLLLPRLYLLIRFSML